MVHWYLCNTSGEAAHLTPRAPTALRTASTVNRIRCAPGPNRMPSNGPNHADSKRPSAAAGIDTALTEDGGAHFSTGQETRSHAFPWTKIVIPLDGTRLELRNAAVAGSTARALVIAANWPHELRASGPAMALFVAAHRFRAHANLGSGVRQTDPAEHQALARIAADMSPHDTLRAVEAACEVIPHDTTLRSLDPRVREAMVYLADGPHWRADKLAIHVGLSKSRLSRLFHAQVGMTLRSYALFRRLLQARVRRDDFSSIAALAQATGFADQAHLARTARRFLGKPISYGGRIVQA
ncbi:MAG: helix-turn-helix domain-containing protein [Myxococcales bacterium FL481]|nr:MAG: helix-turn-helix domain-containing protein [Myxococcales bacterium FL481]